jgi:uncharacterized protein (DUF433 family)
VPAQSIKPFLDELVAVQASVPQPLLPLKAPPFHATLQAASLRLPPTPSLTPVPWLPSRASTDKVACSMNDRIVIDPKVCHGKPVVRGTRMPVALIVGSLAGGMSFEDVQREYALTVEDIRAALKFAGELVEQEQYHPLPG